MTWEIYFIEKTYAQLCASVHRTNDWAVREMIVAYGEAQGYEVRIEGEG